MRKYIYHIQVTVNSMGGFVILNVNHFILTEKIRKKYKSFGKEVMMATIKKNIQNVGISLAGHQDRTKMAVFICGLHPQGAAFECGQLKIGDEIIEVTN